MQLGALIKRLDETGDRSTTLDALGDVVLLAEVEGMGARYGETAGEYVAGAARRFAAQAEAEDWLSLTTPLDRSDDPGRSALAHMVRWALRLDAQAAPPLRGPDERPVS